LPQFLRFGFFVSFSVLSFPSPAFSFLTRLSLYLVFQTIILSRFGALWRVASFLAHLPMYILFHSLSTLFMRNFWRQLGYTTRILHKSQHRQYYFKNPTWNWSLTRLFYNSMFFRDYNSKTDSRPDSFGSSHLEPSLCCNNACIKVVSFRTFIPWSKA